MDNPNPIRYSDLIAPDDSITKLIEQLDDLINKYKEAKSNIQGAAAETAKSMQNLSGATEEQRQAIAGLSAQSEKLLSAYKQSADAESETYRRRQQVIMAVKEQQRIDKLIVQINTSVEGSYNRLSAQYRLNKIRLDEMSAAERKGTEAGRALEAETNAIYEEMKRLQEATGKHQLNVGNYADAAKGLKLELTDLIRQMALMKANGEDTSDEYVKMAQRAGQLRDAMSDAQQEVNAMASDTANLDAVAKGASAAQGGMSAITSITALLGATSETATEAQKNLGLAVGIVSGATVVQNALQKQSALMTGIRTLQTKAAAKAELLDAAAKQANTKATIGATIAQKAFNLVASANPYVLLAIALITVVGALVAFSSSASNGAKSQQKLNEAIAAGIEYQKQLSERTTATSKERVNALTRELEIAKAERASMQETRDLEDKIAQEKTAIHNRNLVIYKSELHALETNRAKLAQLQKDLLKAKQAQASGKSTVTVDVNLDGKVEKVKVADAIDAIQGQIDNYGQAVQIAVELKEEGEELNKERILRLAQRKQEDKAIAEQSLAIERQTQDARFSIFEDAEKREIAIRKAAAQRTIADLQKRLSEEKNLTVKDRENINQQILIEETKLQRDIRKIRNQYGALNLQAVREVQDMELSLMQDGAEKSRKELDLKYTRQIEDLQIALATQEDLTVTQQDAINKKLELIGEEYAQQKKKLDDQIAKNSIDTENAAIQLRLDTLQEGSQEEIDLRLKLIENERKAALIANRQAAKEMQQDEAAINAKYDAQVLKTSTELERKRAELLLSKRQELAQSEFNLLNKNERQKTEFALQQEQERLEMLLELDKEAGVKMTEQERQTIENTLSAIQKERDSLGYNNIWEVFGIGVDDKQQEALGKAISAVKDSVMEIVDAWNAAADAALESANKQVEASQKVLDDRLEAQKQGYAADVETAAKELELAKANQAKALEEKKKAQKAQIAIDAVTQATSLITASAEIWKALGGIPYVGPALAIAGIATMWGSFAFAKAKAWQEAESITYGEGTVEMLEGGSHASGHDIDLGRSPDGRRRRAEGGEYFAIINKRNSRRYKDVIPDVINSFNDGTFADKYAKMSEMSLAFAGADLSGLEKDVSAIRKQGEESHIIGADGRMMIRYKNVTRRIRK